MGDREDPPTRNMGGGTGSDLSSPTLELPAGAERRAAGVSRTFAVGSLVAGRYDLVRFIAAGGMGEVYEAEDRELGGRVALKTLRPEITDDPQSLDRFKQEIALARQVTHRNVCRIFDVGWHREGSSADAPGVAFLTMELLAGETLADLLRREGPLPMARAVPLLRQMAEALAAAHAAGVIHRDFKSANVVLEPAEDGVRAVVTDFGLARTGKTTGKTNVGEIAGTPAYMAPEQLQGGATSPATDIYAFGVVMCEVLTGHRPFSGDVSLASVLQRLRKGDISPDLRGARLGRAWEPIVLKCLSQDPQERYADGRALLKALDEAAGESKPRKTWMWVTAAVTLVLIAAAIPFWMKLGSGGSHGGSAGHAGSRRSVAVLGFKNLSGRPEAAWLSTALAEMLSTEMAAGGHLRTISGETVSRAKRDLGVGEEDTLAPDTLAKVRANIGADYVVIGSFIALPSSGGALRLDVRLQDTSRGETLASLAETGTEQKLFDLASQAGGDLRAKLGAGPVSVSDAEAARAMIPSDPDAARLYAQGIEALQKMDAPKALRFFRDAAAAEPSNALIHAYLSTTWSNLGYDQRAKEEAKRAFDLSAPLPKEGRLLVEGRYRVTAGEWDKAEGCFRALWGYFPDNLDYGIQLAGVQSKGGKGKEALATVAEMRKLAAPASKDPRVDLAEAEAAQSLADWKHMLAASESAGKASEAVGARGLLAEAKLFQARAWRKLGEPQKAMSAAEGARKIFDALGDREGVAHAQSVFLFILYSKGDLNGARASGEKLLATYREIGNQRGTAMILNSLANVAYDQGDLKSAAADYTECLKVFRDIDDKSSAARVSSNLGNVMLLQGDVAGARRRHEEALALSREIGDQSASAYTLCALGEIEVDEADLAGARDRYEESLALFRKTSEKSGAAYALFGLGEVHLAGVRFDEARKAYEEALSLRDQLGEKGTAAQSRLALANLQFEQGQTAPSELAAREALKAFEEEKDDANTALAWDLIARILLVRGKGAEAKKAAARAVELARSGQDKGLSLTVGITAARARAAAGDPTGARKDFAALFLEAGGVGRQDLLLKVRLHQGELELASGKAAAGEANLAVLEKDASARGFFLIARKAAKR